MSDCHKDESHTHSSHCGHTPISHDGHTDYLHDGHLHHQLESGAVEEHVIDVSEKNPADCTPEHHCEGHDADHIHGPDRYPFLDVFATNTSDRNREPRVRAAVLALAWVVPGLDCMPPRP